jgi:hypothetical protein
VTAAVLPMLDRVPAASVSIGRTSNGELQLDLSRLLAGRLLAQGSSGAGKSHLLRKIVEEAFEYLTTIIVDPEGEFANLADHIGASTLRAVELTSDALTAVAYRSRHHRLPVHLDLSDLEADQRILKAAAFFSGLIGAPREDWKNTTLVAIDEAHLLAPHVASSSRDAEIRRLGVATLTELCARGRKRGIGTMIATQRLAKLASSVVSELHNVLIGLNVFDRDVARAADLLGFNTSDAQRLRQLPPGEFFAFGPALSPVPILTHIQETVTHHTGATPDLLESAYVGTEESRRLLDLEALEEAGAGEAQKPTGRRGGSAVDSFLLEPAAAPAVRIIEALAKISPNATTGQQLSKHLGLDSAPIDAGLDLLASIGAVDTMPRGETRIARLSARIRLRVIPTEVVGLD